MPSGKTHLIIEGIAAIPSFAMYQAMDTDLTHAVFFGTGYAIGSLLLSPDIDLPQSHPSRRWGWLRSVWLPYQRCFKHRGMSHNLAWGPVTRLAYLGVLLVLLRTLIGHAGVQLPGLGGWPLESLILGVYCANGIHVFADLVVSGWKRTPFNHDRKKLRQPRKHL